MKVPATLQLLLVSVAIIVVGACEYTRTKPVAFPHGPHLTSARCGGPGQPDCLSCNTCHAGARDPSRPIVPEADDCKGCHENGAELLKRSVAPHDPDYPLGRAIRFSHQQHLDQPQIGGQCVKCHAGVVSEKPGKTNFPPMSTCLSCHREDFDKARCTPCHEAGHLRRLVPETFSRHDTGWLRRHGAAAKRVPEQCNQCHSESDCADCHDTTQRITVEARNPEKIEANFVHRGDFFTRHPIEARSQPTTCLKCHSTSSCDSCHTRYGVSGNAVGSPNPHPIGWVGPDTSSKNFHGRAARRDIVSCATCHEQGPATNCIRCHKVGGGGGNPHPSGWNSSRGTGAAMCRYCHEP